MWPAWLSLRAIARSLVCTDCHAHGAMVTKVAFSPFRGTGTTATPLAPDVTLNDLATWFLYVLWWRDALASGRLPPVVKADFSWQDEWDIEKVWANGIAGATPVEQILANPDPWRLPSD